MNLINLFLITVLIICVLVFSLISIGLTWGIETMRQMNDVISPVLFALLLAVYIYEWRSNKDAKA